MYRPEISVLFAHALGSLLKFRNYEMRHMKKNSKKPLDTAMHKNVFQCNSGKHLKFMRTHMDSGSEYAEGRHLCSSLFTNAQRSRLLSRRRPPRCQKVDLLPILCLPLHCCKWLCLEQTSQKFNERWNHRQRRNRSQRLHKRRLLLCSK